MKLCFTNEKGEKKYMNVSFLSFFKIFIICYIMIIAFGFLLAILGFL